MQRKSITFNDLRKDILGEDLTKQCDANVADILEKQKEIYKLKKQLDTVGPLRRGRITQKISDLSGEIDILSSRRDDLNNEANTKTGDFFSSPLSQASSYNGKFFCNLDKDGRPYGTENILKMINDNYNTIRLGKDILGNYYDECIKRDLSEAEKNKIAKDRKVDVSDVEKLCSNLRKELPLRNISTTLRSSNYWYTMYTKKEYVMIEFERLFNTDIELREEIITNVKKFIDNELDQWRTLVTGWRNKNEPVTLGSVKRKLSEYLYGSIPNFKELTSYLAENLNNTKFNSLYTTIREKKPDISSNITILNPLWEFYSAYPTDMTNQEFSQKNYIWLTPEIAQSLLYILGEKDMIQPVIFKFKFKRPLILLNSQTQKNTDIRGMFITRDVLTPEQFDAKTDKINNILGQLDGGENSKILYFIDVINKLINDENYRIDGYRNRRDQNEIAVVDLSSVIDTKSITKGIFQKVSIKNPGITPNEITFPFASARKMQITGMDISRNLQIYDGTWNGTDSRANCPLNIYRPVIDPVTGRMVIDPVTRKFKQIMIKTKALYTLIYRWEGDQISQEFRCLGDPSFGNTQDDTPQYVNDV